METFDFSPKELFESVKLEDYLTFLTYTLEYRAVMLEQVSHEREEKYLAEHPNPDDRTEGYGVIAMDYTIRDLKGRLFSFFSGAHANVSCISTPLCI